MIVSLNTYDVFGENKIAAIISFDNQGRMAPLYFRIKDKECKVIEYVLHDLDSRYNNVYLFTCIIACEGYKRQIDVSYHKCENIWLLRDSPL